MVSRATGLPVAKQAPVVGEYAFRHNAGLHVAAVFHDPSHYESIPAELVRRTRSVAVGRFAGLVSLRYKARELGLNPDAGALERVLARIKESEAGDLPDAQVLAMFQAEGCLPNAVGRPVLAKLLAP